MKKPAVSSPLSRPKLLKLLPAILIGFLTIGLVGHAFAGDVTGRIAVTPGYQPSEPAAEDAPRDHTWEEWNGAIPVRAERFQPERSLLVVLTGASASSSPTGCSFKLSNGGLTPSTLAAKVGSDLDIQNLDGCSHELFVEGMEEFAPLSTAPRGGRSVRMPSQPGTHEIQDALYPHVHGHLHVLSDLVACGQVQRNGSYSFSDIEPGEYTLRVFHGSEEVSQQQITVEDGSRDTTISSISFPGDAN